MMELVVEAEALHLPGMFADQVRGKKVQIAQTRDGILISPVHNAISAAKGMLKGDNYGTELFMAEKHREKELEHGK